MRFFIYSLYTHAHIITIVSPKWGLNRLSVRRAGVEVRNKSLIIMIKHILISNYLESMIGMIGYFLIGISTFVIFNNC